MVIGEAPTLDWAGVSTRIWNHYVFDYKGLIKYKGYYIEVGLYENSAVNSTDKWINTVCYATSFGGPWTVHQMDIKTYHQFDAVAIAGSDSRLVMTGSSVEWSWGSVSGSLAACYTATAPQGPWEYARIWATGGISSGVISGGTTHIVYGDGVFVALFNGYSSPNLEVLYTSDPTVKEDDKKNKYSYWWRFSTQTPFRYFIATYLTYINGYFIIGGGCNDNGYSSEGRQSPVIAYANSPGGPWEIVRLGTAPLRVKGVTYAGGYYVVYGAPNGSLYDASLYYARDLSGPWKLVPVVAGHSSVNHMQFVYGNGYWIMLRGYALAISYAENIEGPWTTIDTNYNMVPNGILFEDGKLLCSASRGVGFYDYTWFLQTPFPGASIQESTE